MTNRDAKPDNYWPPGVPVMRGEGECAHSPGGGPRAPHPHGSVGGDEGAKVWDIYLMGWSKTHSWQMVSFNVKGQIVKLRT